MTKSSQTQTTPAENKHKRTKSSVLKAIVAPLNHKRTPSAGLALTSPTKTVNIRPHIEGPEGVSILPLDHPHRNQPLAESNHNEDRRNSHQRKSIEVFESPDKQKKPKKSKSSTSLSALFSRPKSSKSPKKEDVRLAKDKENQTPPGSSHAPQTPIWAQFASQAMLDIEPLSESSAVKRWSIEDEVALYTPNEYSPLKQRSFHEHSPATAARRPKPAYINAGPTVASFTDTVSKLRRTSGERLDKWVSRHGHDEQQLQANNEEGNKQQMKDEVFTRSSSERGTEDERSKLESNKVERGSRVMAAVVAWNGKTKEPAVKEKEVGLDNQTIESAFETLLDSRNVPQNMRDKMRSLDTNIKANFIKQDRSGSASSTENLAFQGISKKTPTRPGTGQRSMTEDVSSHDEDQVEEIEDTATKKKSRPRSLTFTLSKGDASPTKKQKSEGNVSHGRKKSGDLRPSSSSKSLASTSAAQTVLFMNKASKTTIPEDFISYLQKIQKPELVEVGRLHKLRQLLRNETVSWVDSFIAKGGMTEIVALLHRIIKMEWREEHEDSLLHETLLCLKALCTTSLALAQLSTIQDTLFPTLLNLLFNDDRKGPSEFTTRNIIISLLFTHLCASPTPSRASEILSYLRDPSKPEEAQPPGFITSIYVPRPYRVWCKDIANVTKEVFWIFLHHLNVVPYPHLDSSSDTTYTAIHFPLQRPPVPAAPYVGGVEWDATNYLSAHLDLLNGIIACLPTLTQRNALRQELRDSGFEKIMGAKLRTCKVSLYGGVHAGLSTWIGAGREDGWDVIDVREGPKGDKANVTTASGSPGKKKREAPPKLELPKLDMAGKGVGIGDGDLGCGCEGSTWVD